jgi:DnaJ-class molecular chaperone
MVMNTEEAYKELGLSSNATPEDIKKSYRSLAKQWHPDLNRSPGAEDKFKRINQAYEIVCKKTTPSTSNIYDGVNWQDFTSNQFFKDFLKKYSFGMDKDTFRNEYMGEFSKSDRTHTWGKEPPIRERKTRTKITIELEDPKLSMQEIRNILEERGIKLKTFEQTVSYDDF